MYNQPHPIGYIELQRAWVGIATSQEACAYEQALRDKAASEYPSFVQTSSRCERSVDGAGVEHFCLYMGFAPGMPSSEPLDPRNLNNAEHADQIGDPGRDLAIGMKEQKF